jgi:transposase-like protein
VATLLRALLRNALDHLPRSATGRACRNYVGCTTGATPPEARTDLNAWLQRWQDKHSKLCAWVEANIEETFAYYRLPPSASQAPQVD